MRKYSGREGAGVKGSRVPGVSTQIPAGTVPGAWVQIPALPIASNVTLGKLFNIFICKNEDYTTNNIKY